MLDVNGLVISSFVFSSHLAPAVKMVIMVFVLDAMAII